MSAVVRKTVKAKIHKRLIGEVTRFFGGWETMLQEIFQNVYRSGAKRLDVTFDKEMCLLEFRDDGVGCPDPQILLSAGGTGWNEGKVKAPAGLGFFSLFDPSIVSNVIVSSHRWQLTIPPELATSRTLQVKQLSRERTGFLVQLYLQPEFVETETASSYTKLERTKFSSVLAEKLTTYPFKLFFNGKRITNDDAKALRYAVQLHSDKWGTMYMDYGGTARHNEVIWEHRMTSSKVFQDALHNAAQGDPFLGWIAGADTLRRCGGGPRLTWRINTECGVQPKLPDRNDLINNGHLNRAAKAWLQLIAQWHDNGRHEKWMDVIRNTKVYETPYDHKDQDSVAQTAILIHNAAIEPLLIRHGWRENSIEDVARLELTVEGNSLDIDPQAFSPLWVRNGVPVSEHDFMVLRNYDTELFYFDKTPMVAREGEETVPIVYEWEPPLSAKDIEDGKYQYVAAAKSITWNGQAIPFYFLTEEERDQYHVAVLLAGTPQEVAKILEVSFCDYRKRDVALQEIFDLVTKWLISLCDRGNLFGQHIYDTGWEGENLDDDDSEYIQYAKMYGELRDEFYARYLPHKLELGMDFNLLVKLADSIHDADIALTELKDASKERSVGLHDRVKKMHKALTSYSTRIDADIERIKKKLEQSVTPSRSRP